MIERTDEKAISSFLQLFWKKDKFLYLIFAVLLLRLRMFNISCFSFTRSWDIREYPKNFGSHVTPAMPIFLKKYSFLFPLSLQKRAPNF